MDNIPQKDTTKDMKNLKLKRKAFTMLEFVFVIIVLGILGSIGMSRYEDNSIREASDSILSDIRYTQHLALIDDKFNPDPVDPTTYGQWQRAFWRIGFNFCGGNKNYYEYIGSDMNYGGGISNDEAARDPLNGKKMLWNSQTCDNGGNATTSDRIFITYKYGIKAIVWSGGCSNKDTLKHIGFDHLGRPHQGFTSSNVPDYRYYIKTTCTITFTMSNDDTFAINIEPETGYAYIVGEPNS